MDTLRGHFPDRDEPDHDSFAEDDALAGMPPEARRAAVGKDERRMQVRAYNFWAGLLGNRTFPDISDLHPDRLDDFGPYSVLLDFSEGLDDPAIGYLGGKLAEECDATRDLRRLSEVPSRSLLSRITDHYMQILGNAAPVGFEAEFVNQRGATILYRGILLPFSRNDETIDYIYGVINWKELADQAATDALMRKVDETVAQPSRIPAMLRDPAPMAEWADGPADSGDAALQLSSLGLHGDYFDFEHAPGIADDGEYPLGDWLAAAREEAGKASASEDRSRQALYAAIGRAYDFVLAAENAPEELAGLLEDAGLTVQERAPLVPLVKLVFGTDYDKTRIAEFAAVIAHGRRLGTTRGALAALLADTPGGIKGIVATERGLRRGDDSAPVSRQAMHDRLVEGLRGLSPKPLSEIGQSSEFTVLVARRNANGQLLLLGEVADDNRLLERAARHLLG